MEYRNFGDAKPQIGAYGEWPTLCGRQVLGTVLEHRGGNTFIVETPQGKIVVDIGHPHEERAT